MLANTMSVNTSNVKKNPINAKHKTIFFEKQPEKPSSAKIWSRFLINFVDRFCHLVDNKQLITVIIEF